MLSFRQKTVLVAPNSVATKLRSLDAIYGQVLAPASGRMLSGQMGVEEWAHVVLVLLVCSALWRGNRAVYRFLVCAQQEFPLVLAQAAGR